MRMQLTTVFALLTASASAWVFVGYTDEDYAGDEVIYENGDDGSNLCFDFHTHDNEMSSFAWFSSPEAPFCSFKLYDACACKGDVLESSKEVELLRSDMGAADNKASSLWVDCSPSYK